MGLQHLSDTDRTTSYSENGHQQGQSLEIMFRNGPLTFACCHICLRSMAECVGWLVSKSQDGDNAIMWLGGGLVQSAAGVDQSALPSRRHGTRVSQIIEQPC